jgi:hypothetical protein
MSRNRTLEMIERAFVKLDANGVRVVNVCGHVQYLQCPQSSVVHRRSEDT